MAVRTSEGDGDQHRRRRPRGARRGRHFSRSATWQLVVERAEDARCLVVVQPEAVALETRVPLPGCHRVRPSLPCRAARPDRSVCGDLEVECRADQLRDFTDERGICLSSLHRKGIDRIGHFGRSCEADRRCFFRRKNDSTRPPRSGQRFALQREHVPRPRGHSRPAKGQARKAFFQCLAVMADLDHEPPAGSSARGLRRGCGGHGPARRIHSRAPSPAPCDIHREGPHGGGLHVRRVRDDEGRSSGRRRPRRDPDLQAHALAELVVRDTFFATAARHRTGPASTVALGNRSAAGWRDSRSRCTDRGWKSGTDRAFDLRHETRRSKARSVPFLPASSPL